MIYVLASILIFGLVHPVSKILLDQGIPLSYFCVLYVGVRFILQLPFLFRGSIDLKRSGKLQSLVVIGLVGAFLQFFEFKGVQEGISPALVTVLMFSYPVWILAVNYLKKTGTVGIFEVAQSLAVVGGIFILSLSSHSSFDGLSLAFLYPLLASVFIAAWIILSNRLRKDGIGSFSLSAYYDLFSLVSLFVIFNGQLSQDWSQFTLWAKNPDHITGVILYSVFVGLLPNLLFYFGSRKVSSHFAGTAMAFEPLFSTLYSAIIWQAEFGSHFFAGSALILVANIPAEVFRNIFRGELAYEK